MAAGAIGTSWATLSWPDTTWEAFSWSDLTGAIALFGDLNDRMLQWLTNEYVPSIFPAADFSTLLQYDLSLRSGDYTTRFRALIDEVS